MGSGIGDSLGQAAQTDMMVQAAGGQGSCEACGDCCSACGDMNCGCFSGLATVRRVARSEERSKGRCVDDVLVDDVLQKVPLEIVEVRSLCVGDRIEVYRNVFETILGWSTFLPAVTTNPNVVGTRRMIRITTDEQHHNGSQRMNILEFTPNHFVLAGSGDFVPAHILKPGDKVASCGRRTPGAAAHVCTVLASEPVLASDAFRLRWKWVDKRRPPTGYKPHSHQNHIKTTPQCVTSLSKNM